MYLQGQKRPICFSSPHYYSIQRMWLEHFWRLLYCLHVFKGNGFIDCKVINNKFEKLTYKGLSYSRNKIEDLKFHKTKNKIYNLFFDNLLESIISHASDAVSAYLKIFKSSSLISPKSARKSKLIKLFQYFLPNKIIGISLFIPV